MADIESLPMKNLFKAFFLLRKDPQTVYLTVPAREEVPETVLDLRTLTAILWNTDTDAATTNAIWSAILAEVRTGNAAWTVVACGLAGPALIFHSRRLRSSFGGDVADIDAEVIEGFLVAMRTTDVDDPDVESLIGALTIKASNIARRSRRRDLGEVAVASDDPADFAVPRYAVAHPDIILARAVRAGVITSDEAEYIGRTRLEERSMEEVGPELGVHPTTLLRRRAAAEKRLVQALADGAI